MMSKEEIDMSAQIRIRAAVPEDAEQLRKIYGHYVRRTAVSFEYDVPSVEEFRTRIGNTLYKYPYFVLEKDGVVWGYAYAGAFGVRAAYQWSAEVSIYLDPACRRQGMGRALYAELEDALRSMGVRNLYACIAVPEQEDEYLTLDSVRFHQKLGYREVGRFSNCASKFGRWYHMVWMEKVIGAHEANPEAVCPYPKKEIDLT